MVLIEVVTGSEEAEKGIALVCYPKYVVGVLDLDLSGVGEDVD